MFKKHSVIKCNFNHHALKYGGLLKICEEIGIKYKRYNEHTRDDVLNLAKELYHKNGKINKDMCCRINGLSSSCVRRYFGSYNNLFIEIGAKINMHKNVTKDDVLYDFKLFYWEYQNPSSTLYRKLGKYNQCVIDRLFGSWSNMLLSIGIKPINKKYTLDYMIDKVKELYDKYGFISRRLIEENCEFTYQSLLYYFDDMYGVSKALGTDNAFMYGSSSAEKEIFIYLSELLDDTDVFRQKTWDWLLNRNNNKMFVDFYIESLNLVIEYDGIQHFKRIEWFHKTEQDFINQQYSDLIKNELIVQHNINLERISYDTKLSYELIQNIIHKYK